MGDPTHCIELLPLTLSAERPATLPGTDASLIWQSTGLWVIDAGGANRLFSARDGESMPSAAWWNSRERLLVLRRLGSSHVMRVPGAG